MGAEKSVEKEEGPRSFAVFLGKLGDDGEVEKELSQELHELVKTCRKTAQATGAKVKGKITFSLDVTVDHTGPAIVKPDIVVKAPKRRRADAAFWLTKGMNLSADNPKQAELPGLRQVKPAEIKEDFYDDESEAERGT